MNKTPVYLVFGSQGSGKSTQAEYLADYLKLPFFDSGKELRATVDSQGANWQEIQKIMRSGTLVPNSYLRTMFDSFLNDHDTSKGLVIDGFPRTMTQAELLKELSAENNWQIISFFVEISDTTAKNRLAGRQVVINGQKTVREDDQPAIVETRLKLFKRETMPVIYWLKSNFTVFIIDGEPSRQEVFTNIKKVIDGK
ncbi:MAG: nucleoside monophosphate kinase [Patescibacteria group bacterium]